MSATTTAIKSQPVKCYGRVVCRGATQEHYETGTNDAGRRARELRAAGWRVTVSALGSQVTDVGRVKMTMLTITHRLDSEGFTDVPPTPPMVEREPVWPVFGAYEGTTPADSSMDKWIQHQAEAAAEAAGL